MKHKLNLQGFLLFSLFFFSAYQTTAAIDFKQGSLENLQKLAAQEGKLYFVNFTASWCSPCKLMDDYTYTDPGLSYYVRQNYLATKVDVDAFDGVSYKQQYNIQSVPSILIFNSKGDMMGRYEGSMSASQMINLLKKYDQPHNRIKSTPSYSRPALKPAPTPKVNAVPLKSIPTPVKPKKVIPQGSGLYRFDVQKQISRGYSVQIGVYADYENVLRETAKFKNLFNQPILVHIDKLTNKTVYRVLVGEFDRSSDANQLMSQVNNRGLEGFVKDLSTLQ